MECRHIWNRFVDRKLILKGRICAICGEVEKDIAPDGSEITENPYKEKA